MLRILGKIYKRNKETMITILAVLIIVALRAFIIYYYVDLKFLWGGDMVPMLNYGQFFQDIFKRAQPWRELGIIFIPQLTITMLNGLIDTIVSTLLQVNPLELNTSFFTNIFLSIFTIIVLWYIASSIIYTSHTHKLASFTILVMFFMFNPWATIDTFKSYFNLTSLTYAFNLALMAYYLRLAGYMKTRPIVTRYELLFIIAIVLTLGTISPSSAVRNFVYLVIMSITFSLYLLLFYRQIMYLKTLLFYSLIPVFIATIPLILYMLAGYYLLLANRVTSYWGGTAPPPETLRLPYGTIALSFIGMSSWIAHSEYMPYYELYERGIMVLLMYLWPIIGFGITLILLMTKLRSTPQAMLQFLYAILLSVATIAWSTGLNPPFSTLKEAIISRVPLLVKIVPIDWAFTTYVMPFYLLATSYTLGLFITLAFNIANKYRKIIMMLIITSIIFMVLYTALPIYTGDVFKQYFNQSISGFVIPKDYVYLKELNLKFYEHAVLLPGTTTYTSTKWGWQGSVAWYHRLNQGLLVYTLAPYSEYSIWQKIYTNLTRPCIHVVNGTSLIPYVNLNKISSIGGEILYKALENNDTLYFTVLLTKSAQTDIIIPLKNSIDISSYEFLEISVSIRANNSNMMFSPWIFINSGRYGGVHILPNMIPNITLVTAYAVGVPDKPWPASKYDPKNVTGFIVRIKVQRMPNTTVILSIHFKIAVGEGALCNQYLNQLNSMRIKYIVIDKSLSEYNLFYDKLIKLFSKYFTLVFNGSNLIMFETSIKSTPFYAIPDAHIEFFVLSPYKISAKLHSVNNTVMLVFPMLYEKGFPLPLKVESSADGFKLAGNYTSYGGLLSYTLKIPENDTNISIDIIYPTYYIILYILQVMLSLLPLILYIISALLYFKKV